MKITGHEFLQALNDYFSSGSSETEIFILLIFPGVILSIALLFYSSKPLKVSDPFANMSKKDFELLEHIRLQKGLEEFDRDFLINIAFTYSVKTTTILLDPSSFERIEQLITEKLKKNGENPAQNKSLNYLQSLKKKLFV